MKPLLSLVACGVLFGASLLRSASAADIPALIEQLHSNRPGARAEAAELLGQHGPLAAPAVPELVKALSDKGMHVRYEAVIALDRIGPAARDAVPALIDILKNPEAASLHPGAIDALGSIGADAQDAVPVLQPIVSGRDQVLAVSAGLALVRIVPPGDERLRRIVPALLGGLRSTKTHVRQEATTALGYAGKAALPALLELVKVHATDAETAWQAAAALEIMEDEAAPAVPALVAALQSRNEKLLIHAARALGAVGPAAAPALADLQKLLDSKLGTVRAAAAMAIGRLGPNAGGAAKALAARLKDSDEHVRRAAAQALGQIGPPASSAAPALLAMLTEDTGPVAMQAAQSLERLGPEIVPQVRSALKDDKTRHWGVMILGQMGPAAKPAVPALAELLTDKDHELVREVVIALAQIGPDAKAAVPALISLLNNKSNERPQGAAYALGKIGAKEAIPHLKKHLEDKDNSLLRLACAASLALLDPGNEEYVSLAIPRLISVLDDKWDLLRREAATALGKFGPRAAAAVSNLGKLTRDPNPAVRSEALVALAEIGPASSEALPEIIGALSDEVPLVRYTATYTIGRLGEAAKEAVPVLERNLQERDDILQTMSAWALVHVDPGSPGLAEKAVPALIKGLKMPNPRARKESIDALAHFGPKAAAAVEALKAAEQDGDESVRKAAAAARQKISG